MPDYTTIKIKKQTLRRIRAISEKTGEKNIVVAERLVSAEFDRLKTKKVS